MRNMVNCVEFFNTVKGIYISILPYLVDFMFRSKIILTKCVFVKSGAASPWIGLRQKPTGGEPAGGWMWLNADHQLAYAAVKSLTPWTPGQPDNMGPSDWGFLR